VTAISIEYSPETETTRPFLVFKQEGSLGFKLFEDIVPELVNALNSNIVNERNYFWKDICVHKTKTQCKILKYAIEQPLLHIEQAQLTKFVSHLVANYVEKT